jgi:hypothetical protein
MGEAKRRKEQATHSNATVSWEILGDLSGHAKSTAVLKLLEQVLKEYPDSGGNTMQITLETAPRTPIIKAKVIGLGAFMAVVGGMQDLGLTDRLEYADGPENKIDAAFA